MASPLIVWPQPEGKFTDTGEGGMHALMLFRSADKELSTEFDVETAAYTTQPNVITSIADGDVEQADLFPNYKLVNSDPKLEDVISTPLYSVVILGSTPYALWDNTAGTYFGVTSGSLTERGEMLLRILEESYRSQAIFLTCLDS